MKESRGACPFGDGVLGGEEPLKVFALDLKTVGRL